MLVIEDDNGRVFPIPREINIMHVTAYNLDRLKSQLTEAESFVGLRDQRLTRAIHYFQLSHLLFERRRAIADVLSPFHTDIIGAAFLYLWKAVTTVLGDPARRNDRYQKRFRILGFDSSVKDRMDELKKLRDDFDVAHYSLNPQRVDEVEKVYGRAQHFVTDVIRTYRNAVREGRISALK